MSLRRLLAAQIFGKIMVCKDLDTAGRVAREARHLNCVTMKGDQYSKKGTMTGGFIDVTRCGAADSKNPLQHLKAAEYAYVAGIFQ